MYRLGAALYSPNTAGLLNYLNYKQLGYEWAHGILHSYQKGMFVAPIYSICFMVFFPFHSWIDAILEFRLRHDQNSAE